MEHEELYCGYCGTAFLAAPPNCWGEQRVTCGKVCATRLGVWNRWISSTRLAAVSGDVNKPVNRTTIAPSMGKTGVQAINRFKVKQPELELVAA